MIRRVNNAVSEKEGHFGTETEGEKQLRSIVDKQLDTKISLQQQLQQHKTFSHSGDFKEISERLSGKRTMKEFQLIEYLLEQKEELKNCGLTEEEINTYLSFLGKLVLFIKNLHPKVYVEELVALFSSFEPVKYRLLKGRMKGQAFIEFSSVEKAVAAQHLVTGYLLRGRPVIIEYGRGHQNQ